MKPDRGYSLLNRFRLFIASVRSAPSGKLSPISGHIVALTRISRKILFIMLRHWIPFEKLDLSILLLYNSNPVAIPFLQNGWYIKEEGELNDAIDGGDKRKKMSIDSILQDFTSNDWYELSRNPYAISLLEVVAVIGNQLRYKEELKQGLHYS